MVEEAVAVGVGCCDCVRFAVPDEDPVEEDVLVARGVADMEVVREVVLEAVEVARVEGVVFEDPVIEGDGEADRVEVRLPDTLALPVAVEVRVDVREVVEEAVEERVPVVVCVVVGDVVVVREA